LVLMSLCQRLDQHILGVAAEGERDLGCDLVIDVGQLAAGWYGEQKRGGTLLYRVPGERRALAAVSTPPPRERLPAGVSSAGPVCGPAWCGRVALWWLAARAAVPCRHQRRAGRAVRW
jgi:hypothetical protein